MGNGTRTHNARNHNPVLCQLNYTHHIQFCCHCEPVRTLVWQSPAETELRFARRRDSFNQCAARSSPRRQRSSALHLNCSSPIRLILNRNSAKPLALANYVARQKGLVNQCSHQCLHWCQQQSTGLLHLNGSSPKKCGKNLSVFHTHLSRAIVWHARRDSNPRPTA